ncbi:helix-turn-helix domain-containing protein [Nocardia sp. NPDC050406]|uniref:helix-turn-helix domain-containing protein n=1 Tax=Nocardia sp. NPDC050406 TaxID=3364318 RepID=UPI0037A56281
MTLVVEFGGGGVVIEDAEGVREVGGFVAGLPLGAMRIRGEGVQCVEVRMAPGRAYSLLGISPTDLGRGVVTVEDMWGVRGGALRERLAAAEGWGERFAVTKSFLARNETPWSADPEVREGWERILASRGQVRIGELADMVGWSRKRLLARFEAQIGLTPKRAAMLVRFRHAVDELLAGRPAAEVAVECGYTDQAHLCRDVSIFTNGTPGAVAERHLPAIARQRYRAWGKFFQYRPGVAAR